LAPQKELGADPAMDLYEEYERSLSDVDHDLMILIEFSAPAPRQEQTM